MPAAAWAGGEVADLQPQQDGAVVLLDLPLPAPPAAVCRAVFGGTSSGCLSGGGGAGDSGALPAHGLLAEFLQQERGCTGLTGQPWQPDSSSSGGGDASRVLRYRTPLSVRQRLLLPLGPDAVQNREEQRLALQPASSSGRSRATASSSSEASGAILVASRCTSAGVPFSGCFANLLAWQLLPEGAGSGRAAGSLQPWSGGAFEGGGGATRVLLTAVCRFHKPVLDPLRGQIERESIQGMRDVYSAFSEHLLRHFAAPAGDGCSAAGRTAAAGVSNARACSSLAASAPAPAGGSVVAEEPTHKPPSTSDGTEADGADSWAAAQAVVQPALTDPTAPGLLQQAQQLWPAWSRACCRMPAGGGGPAAGVPVPEEAAAALQLVARRALRLPPQQRRQELAKHRVVRGLVEALRLPSQQHSAGTAAASASASSAASEAAAAAAGRDAPAGRPRLASAAGVSAALWALAVLGGSVFWEEEAEALCALLPTCSFTKLYHVSDAAWALATMRHHTPHLALLEAAATALLRRQLACVPAGGGQGALRRVQGGFPSLSRVSSLLWALASLGHRPQALLALLPAVLQLQQQRPADRSGGGGGGGGGELAALCSLGWSLAAAGCLHHPAVAAVAAELAGAAERMPPGGVRKPLLLQLHQFGTALRYEAEQQEAAAEQVQGGQGQGAEQGAAAAWDMLQQRAACRQLLQAAAAAWQAETQQRATKLVSACQSDVAATARGGLGLAVREECAVSGFSVDIAVPSRRLAIEVDGPTHFCRNNGGGGGGSASKQHLLLPMGSTLLKRRLLQRRGWAVASVCAADWERLRGAAPKRAFLAAAVEAAEAEADAAAAAAAAAWPLAGG